MIYDEDQAWVPDEDYSPDYDDDPIDDGYTNENWTDNDALDAEYAEDD